MTTQFSAAPQALGYYYQIRYALYLLVSGRPGFKLSLERTDDIEARSESELRELFQLKHHTGTEPLTNTHKDFWKTILIWSTYLAEGKLNLEDTQLLLVTNAATSPESIPNLLTPGNRKVDDALEKMREVASSSTNQSLQAAFNKFKDLTRDKQKALVDSILVLDLAPDVEAIENDIRDKMLGVPHEYRAITMEWLEGWWIKTAIKHLKSSGEEYIEALEVQGVVAERGSLIARGHLPHSFSDAEPDQTPLENVPQYIRQLIKIGATPTLIRSAKRDYIRAFNERSYWAHHKIIFPVDENEYEKKLVDEWEHLLGIIETEFFLKHGASIAEASEDSCREFGVRLYREVCEINVKLKKLSVENYVVRGSYHMLADMSPPAIGWHPHFRTILDELIRPALQAA